LIVRRQVEHLQAVQRINQWRHHTMRRWV
jgi:hypothetical protein